MGQEKKSGEIILRYFSLPFKGVDLVEWKFDELPDENYQVVATPSWFTAIRIFEKKRDSVTISTGSCGSKVDFVDVILVKQI